MVVKELPTQREAVGAVLVVTAQQLALLLFPVLITHLLLVLVEPVIPMALTQYFPLHH